MISFEDATLNNGYGIFESKNKEVLLKLRLEIYNILKSTFNLNQLDPEMGLNYLHETLKNIDPLDLNRLRMDAISQISDRVNFCELIFLAFEDVIRNLLGPDLLVQKTCNLVIQMPNDPNPSELHRDAPANSPYEIVVWIPLVDCYESKGMYMLSFTDSAKALESLSELSSDWSEFEKKCRLSSVSPPVKFGQSLIFNTACLHGSDINTEKETRVSINVRFKGLFSPGGLKNQLQFFKVLRISEITAYGMAFEKIEFPS